MYKTILVTLDTTSTDRAIIEHVKALALRLGSSVALLHVATGVSAQFHGPDAETKNALFNWGLGAAAWLFVGRILYRAIRP